MAEPLEYLEYAEESDGDDLFGSGDEDLPAHFAQPDHRVPIVSGGPGPSTLEDRADHQLKPIPTPITVLKTKDKDTSDVRVTPDQRQVQLREMRATLDPPPMMGVRTLKQSCSLVIRRNAMRIYNVGGVPYSILATFLDYCSREQLAEIEENSPHLLKDTDWLWESFVIAEYPVFYETCRLRKGRPRTTGWRRMYEKGKEDAEQRRTQAMERVANRYREIEKERASKRIVVMDTLVAPKKKSGWGSASHSMSQARRGASAAATYNNQNKLANAISKARSESQRARVALTHASGKFVPPTAPASTARRRANGESELYNNPYNNNSASSSSKVLGPRLPAPRVPRPKGAFSSAYPTPDSPPPARPAAVVVPTSGIPQSQPLKANEERFRIGGTRREIQAIRKPQVESFAPRKVVDFFSASSPMSAASPKRPAIPAGDTVDAKRQRTNPTGDKRSPDHDASASASATPLHSPPGSQPTSRPPSRPHTPGGPPRPSSQKPLESVLFVKKRKPPPMRR